MDTPAILGPFSLRRQIGRGGMGTVWSGVHEASGHAVALKVVRTDAEGTRTASLQREVQAVAALDHPHVVRIFDHGIVGPDAGPDLPEGGMWMAMELAAGCAADRGRTPNDWAGTRELLVDCLRGLGHAHGAGVLHRDCKPDNVLWFPNDPDGARWRLTDFGIALHRNESAGGVVGSPRQMSPEQVRGDARAQGPWTDLYGLGCLAWELLTGGPLFRGEAKLVLHHQLHTPPPEFLPRMPVPKGLEPWLRQLLAKPPGHRFPTAAHALAGLSTLGEVAPHVPGPVPELESTQSITWSTALFTPPPTETRSAHTQVADADCDRILTDAAAHRFLPVPRVEAPTSWRGPVRTRDAGAMGAGLGLLGLRVPPLVGRDQERTELWTQLRAVATTRRPRVVGLDGPPGAGRSRLAQWTGRRAHERIGAHAWSLRSQGGLPGLAAQILSCRGATEREAQARIAALLPPDADPDGYLARGWLELVGPQLFPPLDDPPIGRTAAALMASLLRHATRDRVAVIHAEASDTWSAPTNLAEVLLAAPGELPVLLVLDGVPTAELRGAKTLPIGSLGPAFHRELIRASAWVEPSLEARLGEQCAGFPRLAQQRLAELVEAQALVTGADGLRLADGVALGTATPDHAARRRLARLLARDPDWRLQLERAAVLGQEVDRALWSAALDGADPTALEAALITAGHARPTPTGWAFSGRSLHRAVLALADDAGRLKAHHQACAETLARLRPTDLRRRSQHLAGAGAWAEALVPLFEAIDAGQRTRTAVEQEAAIAEALVLLDRLEAPEDDPERARLALQQTRHDVSVMRQRAAVDHGRRAIAHGTPEVQREARHQLALILARLGELDEAWTHLDQLTDWRPEVVAFDRGVLLERSGDPEGAAEALRESVRLADDRSIEAMALRQLAFVESRSGKLDDARAHFRQAARINLELGKRFDAGMCRSGEASVLKDLGQSEAARKAYGEAIALLDSVGAPTVAVPLLNLASLLLATGQTRRAHRHAERARELFQRAEQLPLLAACQATLVECHATAGNWAQVGRDLEPLTALIERTGFRHESLAQALDRCADLARRAKRPIVRRIEALAAAQWESLE